MPKFLVIGIWPDTEQRFTETVEAKGAEEAECDVKDEHPGLVIAATLREYGPEDNDLPEPVETAARALTEMHHYDDPSSPRVLEVIL